MTWSEKAIEAAWKRIATSDIPKVCTIDRDDLRAALDAAQAIEGDAAWNAAIEMALKKLFSVPLDNVPLFAQHEVSARDMEIADAIRSLKKG